MRRRVSADDFRQVDALVQERYEQDTWWVCDEYGIRGDEIAATYSPPYLFAPDSPRATGEEHLHWTEYRPLKETPDLFLKLAALHQKPNFKEAALAFSYKYGVPGGNSDKGGLGKPYRMSLPEFQKEAEQAWTILKMYEAVLNQDWQAAKSLLSKHAWQPDESLYADEELASIYLQRSLMGAAIMVNTTVKALCKPTIRFTESVYTPTPDPAGVKRAWQFANLLGAAYLQMYWLMTSGDDVARCEYCGQIISLSRPSPEGRKRRKDKRFCDDACRQAQHRSKKKPKVAKLLDRDLTVTQVNNCKHPE